MLYVIQNSFGEVYGIFPMPATTKSAEGIAHILKDKLADILGSNGVLDAPLMTATDSGYVPVDRVIIDISPVSEELGRLIFLCMKPLLPQPM